MGDFLSRLIKSCLRLGAVPDLNTLEDLTPVDYVSQALVHISRQPASLGSTFHLVNPHPARLGDIVEAIRSFGYALQAIPFQEWQAQLVDMVASRTEDPLFPLLSLFSNGAWSERVRSRQANMGRYDCQNTLRALANSPITCSPVSRELVHTYLSHFVRVGYLDAPAACATPIDQEGGYAAAVPRLAYSD